MITVFYGTQVHKGYRDWRSVWADIKVGDPIYQEGYVFVADSPLQNVKAKWYRVDGTPVLLEDVPKQLQMLKLVLNL